MKKIALILVLALCAVTLCGCAEITSLVNGGNGNFSGGNAEINDRIESLDISWTSGSVKIAYHAESTVTLAETANRSISKDEQLQWKVEGTTLKVEYMKPGVRINSPSKHLVITLPEGISLKKVNIGCTSADIEVPSLTADTVILDSTSGDVSASVTAPDITAHSTSGDVKLTAGGKVNTLGLSSTSGALSADLDEVSRVSADSTSGKIRIAANMAGQLSAHSTSGNIHVALKRFDQADIGATSGDVTVELPAEPGFTLKYTPSSGKLNTEIPLSGSKENYTCGNGSAQITVDTSSGDLTVRPIQ